MHVHIWILLNLLLIVQWMKFKNMILIKSSWINKRDWEKSQYIYRMQGPNENQY